MAYKPREIESKWRKFWEDNQTYKISNDSDLPKFYVLDMFPYPSGAGLHVGHPLGYIASDIYARYKRLKGYNVLHPMGYDSFGLPAEQYAITMGVHPAISTDKNIAKYRSQLDNLGFSFDWSREVRTSNPGYYKWTQWIFLQLFDHYYDIGQNKAVPISDLKDHFSTNGTKGVNAVCGEEYDFSAEEWNAFSTLEKENVIVNYRLAYRKKSYVNWCEALGTVLANDEVKDGVSERGGHPVERKAMLQWSLRITAYAERLLNDLKEVEWTDSLKAQQANWIGRSEGAQVFFELDCSDEKLEIFTTRPDTIFGATYMALAPEHPFVDQLTTAAQKEKVDAYKKYVGARTERERMAEVKEVTGCFIGAYAINPFNGAKIPVWIAEYVLMDYGTGAIMAVPSDDERDQDFAKKFDLPIVDVVDKTDYPGATLADKVGKMINSEFLNGMEVKDAIQEILKRIEDKGIGKRRINYKLRDAIFSRQRYWGEPVPIVFDKENTAYPLDPSELPLELPEMDDIKPSENGEPPLARNRAWVELENGMERETDTMPGYAGSSWYFLRYMDPDNPNEFASPEALNYWREVDLYVGGTEHAVGHLMYSRFWHKFLYDKGLVPTNEPFRKLINQGMIQGVIEYMYLLKAKKDGHAHFICARLAKERNEEDIAKIPVHIDFVQDYGSSNSHMNIESINSFIDWRPDYKDAIFECSGGTYQHGNFSAAKEGATESHLFTHSDVGKMSKRYFNVVNPDDVVEKYGSDTFRMYEMFLGPIEQSKPWDTKGIDGVSKFLRKFWALFFDEEGNLIVTEEPATKAELKVLHTAIKKVNDDIERFAFNTCVSAFMMCVNELRKLKTHKKEVLSPLVQLLAPFAPHVTEELWSHLGHEPSIHKGAYPVFNAAFLEEDAVSYPISINGKKRGVAEFPSTASKEELEQAAIELEVVKKWSEGKTIRKVIVVPKRMINVVVG